MVLDYGGNLFQQKDVRESANSSSGTPFNLNVERTGVGGTISTNYTVPDGKRLLLTHAYWVTAFNISAANFRVEDSSFNIYWRNTYSAIDINTIDNGGFWLNPGMLIRNFLSGIDATSKIEFGMFGLLFDIDL
jgi:hypothetical protein